jgi:hypothetical protein
MYTSTQAFSMSQVMEARAALRAADAALTAIKAEFEAADKLTLAQGALQGGALGCYLDEYPHALL